MSKLLKAKKVGAKNLRVIRRTGIKDLKTKAIAIRDPLGFDRALVIQNKLLKI